MSVLDDLDALLDGGEFRHERPEDVRRALQSLMDIDVPLLSDYLARFRGPLGSTVTGFLLLDAIEEDLNVVSLTEYLRNELALARNWIVLSDVIAGAVLMYDAVTDRIFDVDFEGGVDLLRDETLEPSADSLEAFLRWFHSIPP